MSKDNGGPAFPSNGTMGEVVCEGMTLRDYIAIHATDEDIRSQQWKRTGRYSKACIMTRSQARYAYADAMLLKRDK